MDNQPENNVPNESPVTSEPAPAAPEQPAAAPAPQQPAPMEEHKPMGDMGGGEKKGSKGMILGLVVVVILVIAAIVLL